MKVLKFGGSSVADSSCIKKVRDVVVDKSKDTPIAVVVSAFGGITDMLLECSSTASSQEESYKTTLKKIEQRHFTVIQELLPSVRQSKIISKIKQDINSLELILQGVFALGELSLKTQDRIISNGELLCSYIISEYFKSENLDANFKNSRELITTDNNFGNALVDFKSTDEKCQDFFDNHHHHITVLPGFVASTKEGIPTTLGRGGSDYSGAIIASAINASNFEVWTDVSGVYTANPKLVKQAQPIEKLSYMEVMELSHFGAKVIYPPTIQPILEKNIPLYVKNTFDPNALGTFISNNNYDDLEPPVKGISYIDNMALLMIEGSGIIGVAGVSKEFFKILFNENVNVVLITQASSEHSICVCVHQKDAKRAQLAINKAFKKDILMHLLEPCTVETELSILAIVGDHMKNHQGISGKMLSVLGKNNVNVRAIAQGASERNISTVISKKDASKALNTLHEYFFEGDIKLLNLFITGVGNVGQKFIEQIHHQNKYLQDNFKLNLRVVAISNSKKMYFDEKGINLSKWKKLLTEKGTFPTKKTFFNKTKELNLRNSIFVDNTASAEISEIYAEYLQKSIGVVTCNKIACSSSTENYKYLKKLSKNFNAPLMFETNVGAALPIIDTLKNLIASGDEIKEIQAVLSGSLNFVFNEYNGNSSFYDVVKQAKEEGYTEPDPKIDLSGIDVARKILILVRESGYDMEIEDVENSSFLPKESLKTSDVDSFFKSLIEKESHFRDILDDANKSNCRLKYVASFKDGKAKVGIQNIPSNHPFYNLEGKDNIVLFFTNRYSEQPLLIKGAGAGAEVTASGIFSDIIRVGNL